MPVKIQELVIQARLKTVNSSPNTTINSKLLLQKELIKFEKKMQHNYIQTINNLLRQKQER